MIWYFIIAHCTTFTTNFSIKLKSLFQVIFGQDSFPLKMSPFQVSLLQNSTNCLLANGLWNNCFHHYSFFLQKRFPSLLASTWVVVSYSYFVEQTDMVAFPDYSFATTKCTIFVFICLQMVPFEYFQYDIIFDFSE